MQYSAYTCAVTNNSNVVTGNGTKFDSNVTVGDSFKIAGETVLYQVSAITSDTALILSVPYAGVTNATAAYQITTDFTPFLGLAEINAGDQDWATHLTVEVIRKIDSAVAGLATGYTFKGGWNASNNTPAIATAAVGNAGWVYRVTTAGTFSLGGNAVWTLGDSVISNGSAWFRIPTPDISAAEASALASASSAAADRTIVSNITKALQGISGGSGRSLSSGEVYSSIISNVGQTTAADLQLPAASGGMNFMLTVGAASGYAWRIRAGATDKIYFNGTAGIDNGYVGTTTPVVGSYLSVFSFQTGASSWDWMAVSGSGGWGVI